MRNHGFIFTSKGWLLPPAFDLNPNPLSEGLLLNISETDNSQSFELAKEVGAFFRVSLKDRNSIIKEITKRVREWRKEARSLKISAAEQDRMSHAFRLANGN